MNKMVENTEFSIDGWIEKDITQDVLDNKLPRAFSVEDYLSRIRSILNSGKFPILIGDSGVGKTAVIYEYISKYSEELDKKKILQISIKQKASTLKEPFQQIGFEMLQNGHHQNE